MRHAEMHRDGGFILKFFTYFVFFNPDFSLTFDLALLSNWCPIDWKWREWNKHHRRGMDIVSDSDRSTSGPYGNLVDGNDDSEYHHTVKAIQYKEH